MLERDFQRKLVQKIKKMLPNAHVWKNDAFLHQGVPDILILYGPKWAVLECKRSEDAPHRPNQDHYVAQMNQESFAAFVYPENEEAVLKMLEAFMTYKVWNA